MSIQYLLLHLVGYIIICHVTFKKLHCILVRQYNAQGYVCIKMVLNSRALKRS